MRPKRSRGASIHYVQVSRWLQARLMAIGMATMTVLHEEADDDGRYPSERSAGEGECGRAPSPRP